MGAANANPLLESNEVMYNDIGLWFLGEATPAMNHCGGVCSEFCPGANSIHHNTTYHVATINVSTYVDSRCNYFLKNPKPEKFFGLVNYIPYLTQDPLPVSEYQGEETVALPMVYRLSQNHPNPFNPMTTIPYAVPAPGGQVSIRIYNVQGQLVRTLVEETADPGYHATLWEGCDNRGQPVASGVYFVEMLAPEFKATRKLLIVK